MWYGMEFKEILKIENEEEREEAVNWYLRQVEESLDDISNRFCELKGGERIRITLEREVFIAFADWYGKFNDIQAATPYHPHRWFIYEELIIEEGD